MGALNTNNKMEIIIVMYNLSFKGYINTLFTLAWFIAIFIF